MADWESRERDLEDRPFRTLLKWGAGFLVLLFLLGVIWGALSWISGWGGEAKRITGPENTRTQVTAVLDDWNGLKAAAANACDAKGAAGSADDPTLVESPDFAYRAKYRQIKVDYDRRMGNLFEAALTRHLPLPSTINHLPREAPGLRQMQAEVC